MNKALLVLIVVVFSYALKSQNLVPNPSFEDYYILTFNPPCYGFPCCSLAKPTEWTYANLIYWPDLSGPHYFTSAMNFCTDDEWPIPYQGVPVHSWNGSYLTLNGYYYQEAKDGDAYTLFQSYSRVPHPPSYDLNTRQYPYVQLIDSLRIGRKYCLSFWLSVPDIYYYITSNTVGAYFSTSPLVQDDWFYINVTPHIENMRTDFPDTSNTWYLVSGSFVADSSYQYLTIGNFYPDSLTNVLLEFIPQNNIVGIGLYLDNVALYDCTGHNYKCNAGGNQKICAGESVQLGTEDDSRRQYRWSPATGLSNPSAARPLASPTETTTYYLYVIDEFVQESYDTVTVEVVECNIWVPNSFTPNRDGLNDELCVIGEGIEQLSLVIFNRRSEVVFETKDPYRCWDGTYNGRLAPQGVYVYLLSATLKDGTTVNRDGVVMLIR